PGVVDHLDDGRDAASLLADQARDRAAELHLGRRQRAGAELVLQTLELHAGAARKEEAGETARRPSEDEEDVARRVGAEPLVAGDLVRAVADRHRLRGV